MIGNANMLIRAAGLVGSIAVLAGAVAAENGGPPGCGDPAARPHALPQARDRYSDALPLGARYRIGTLRLQHGANVRNLAGSPDGKLLASAGDDGRLCVWDVATGRRLRDQRVRQIDTSGWLTFTPDSKAILFNSHGKLRLLDIATGAVREVLGAMVQCGAIAPNGKTVTTVHETSGGIWSPTIRRWNLADGKVLKEWMFRPEPPPHDGGAGMRGVEFVVNVWLAPEGNTLAAVETDRSTPDKEKQTLRLHDVASGKELRRWQVGPHLYDLAFSKDGKFIVTGTANTTQQVFDTSTGKEVRRWKSLELAIDLGGFRIAMAPDGESVLSAGVGGLARWDWRTGKNLQTYPDCFAPIAFLGDGRAIAVQGYNNSIYVLDTATGKDLCPLPRPGYHVAFSTDGRRVAWAEGRRIVLGDAATGAELRRWPAHLNRVGSLVFSPDDKTVASTAGGKHVRLWDLDTGKEIHAPANAGVVQLAFSPDGKRLGCTSGYYCDVRVWAIATGESRKHWRGDRLATFDAGMRTIAISDRKHKTLRLVDMVSGKTLHLLPGYQEYVRYRFQNGNGLTSSNGEFPPLFSPDGKLLLAGTEAPSGDADGLVQFWDVANGKRLGPVLDGNKFVLENLAFSPDSRLIALTRFDCTLCLMDAKTGTVVHTLGRASVPMTAPPVFTPDGHTLITAVKGLVQVWEVATGGELCRREGHLGDIDALVVSGDGRSVATIAADNTILVWDLTRLLPADPLSPDAAWAELTNANAAKARRAIESLAAAPGEATALLRQRLAPVRPADPKQLARWIAALGNDDFDARQEATAALDRLGEVVSAELHQALAAGPPLEARRRIDELLRKHNRHALPPEKLRAVRAVQVLEMLGSNAARAILQSLAGGAAGARLTQEARGALDRLTQRAAR